ncbi:MAG: prolyl oligopeptidase [Cyclobacteriaceae bacterium]|jgi:prolyl oligopeptidase
MTYVCLLIKIIFPVHIGSFITSKLLMFIILLSFFKSFSQKTYEYPEASKDSIFDVYFGDSIYDPYQWMENPADPRLTMWLENQKSLTSKLDRQQIRRSTLRQQIASIYSDSKSEMKDNVAVEDKSYDDLWEFRYDYPNDSETRNLQYRKNDQGNFLTLIDSKKLKKYKGENVLIGQRFLNENQNLMAVMIIRNGTDWREVMFFDLIQGTQLQDELLHLRAGSNIVWDASGIYYDAYDAPKEGRSLLDKAKGQTLFFHKIGDAQSNDPQLYQNSDTTGATSFNFGKINDKLYLSHTIRSRGKEYGAVAYAIPQNGQSLYFKNFLTIPKPSEYTFSLRQFIGDTALLYTNWNAPNGKILMCDINKSNALIEFTQDIGLPLKSINQLGKDKIASIHLHNGQNTAKIYSINGNLLKSIDFPVGKKVTGFYENDTTAKTTNFGLKSFYHPTLWYKLDLVNLTFQPINEVFTPYKATALETKYVSYYSKDSTLISMYLTSRKDIELNGKNPTLLYGYGGYGTTIEPGFNQSQALWLLHGGILAIPNIRGGGAEGEDWGKAGRGLKKQNAIDDFIGAADYLIKEKYTNPSKIALNGRSHGGMLVGATITQRPELFKAAIIEAGALDMLRFGNYTAGFAETNIKEFGSVKDSLDFLNLKAYCPLHNIKKDQLYPSTLLMTGTDDDRVPPMHSYKFLAELQKVADPKGLYHIFLTEGAGHGGALTQTDFENQLLYKYYFLFDQLEVVFW